MLNFGTSNVHLFQQPLGTDFARAVVDGLSARIRTDAPEDMARVTLIVNTSRMARRIKSLFLETDCGFLPRILLLSEIDRLYEGGALLPARHPLERRLQLAQLIAPIVTDNPQLAARSSVFALSESLALLMDEMQGEGVLPAAIANLDVTDQSGHWQNAQTLIGIAHNYVSKISTGIDADARQRQIVEGLCAAWSDVPPKYPVILAGSTGSRGTTALLMQSLARLENGAVIVPGFDTDMPSSVWDGLMKSKEGEDHPQYRFAQLMQGLNICHDDVPAWHDGISMSANRNKVMSLALRPAPITNAWLTEGSALPHLPNALQDVTLVEAPSPRHEALTIAMRLRAAAEAGETAALISPDRVLTRQVTAALDRWDLVPDDSAGSPLHLSAPGRFLRQTAELFFTELSADLLLALLKHPLTNSAGVAPQHGLFTQELELHLRRDPAPVHDTDGLRALTHRIQAKTQFQEPIAEWADWLCTNFGSNLRSGERPLADWVAQHRALSERIAAGTQDDVKSELWQKNAGIAALGAMETLEQNAEHGGALTASDYMQLLGSVLSTGEVRDRDEPDPNIMIWGTLEARVQGADLIILGGLNEGVWPESIAADPWLNRRMRMDAGLLLPDRRIGLSAHDFQQAFAAKEVWISRSVRSTDAETVPSRWINRLFNLVDGLPDRFGPEALKEMRERGNVWLAKAAQLETVQNVPPYPRAAPMPPIDARPRDFSVTEIRTLIRDPYAIYAKHCLGLRRLDTLVQEPNAPIRGIVIHEIMERFIAQVRDSDSNLTPETLMNVTDDVMAEIVPWPAARLIWRARILRIADWIVSSERDRLTRGQPALAERTAQGVLQLPEVGGSVRARADRIDLTSDGSAIIYDYKSGSPPTGPAQKAFEKQLLIEAAMVENGAFDTLGPRRVEDARYIGLGAKPKETPAPLSDEPPDATLEGLKSLIRDYLNPRQPYLSRRMMAKNADVGDFDQLARYGEWDDGDPAAPEDLT